MVSDNIERDGNLIVGIGEICETIPPNQLHCLFLGAEGLEKVRWKGGNIDVGLWMSPKDILIHQRLVPVGRNHFEK